MAYLRRGALQAIKSKQVEKLRKQKSEESQDAKVVLAMTWEVQNKEDLGDVRELLRREDLFESTRKWLQSFYLWLSLHPQRSSTRDRKARLKRILRACYLRDRFGGSQSEKEYREGAPSLSRLPRASRRQDKWPDWLKGKGVEPPKKPSSS